MIATQDNTSTATESTMPTETDARPLKGDARTQEKSASHFPAAALTKATAIGLAMACVGALFASAMVWPMVTAEPHDVPIAVAGPEQATEQLVANLNTQREGLFDVSALDNRDQAVRAIEQREVTGAIVVDPATGIEVLTASAGNAQVTQLLTQIADGLQAQVEVKTEDALTIAVTEATAAGATGEQIVAIQQQAAEQADTQKVTVTDIVNGGPLAMAATLTMFPALIAGLSGGIISLLLIKRPAYRFASLGTAALVTGLLGAAVLGPWFDLLQGPYWLQAAALSLGTLAIGSTIVGLGSAFGRPGMSIGALIIVLLANPWGGGMMPSEFLIDPWGTIGSYMPNGTLIQLLKSISFFPKAETSQYWWTLAIWALCGLVFLAAGIFIQRRKDQKLQAHAKYQEFLAQ